MTKWVLKYELECGCGSGRVEVLDKDKLKPGDLWVCPTHGDVEIVKSVGRGA